MIPNIFCTLRFATISPQRRIPINTYVSTHHTVDAVLVPGKLSDLHGIIRIGDVPDTDVRHVTALASRQESTIASQSQRRHCFAAGVQHVGLGVLSRIEQHHCAPVIIERVIISLIKLSFKLFFIGVGRMEYSKRIPQLTKWHLDLVLNS